MNAHECNILCEAGIRICPDQPEGEGPDNDDWIAAAYERQHSKHRPVYGCRCAACDDREDFA